MVQEIGITIYKRENSEKWRPSSLCPFQISTATGPAALTKTACMAIVMTTPVMRAPHQVKKVALNDGWKGRVKKQMRRTKGASRSRDSRIRCVRGWKG